MTLHKIDREKLAKLLDGLKNFDDINIIEQAAQNWLMISDPGFEVTKEMLSAADDAQEPYGADDIYAPLDLLVAVFKAMIAKAGE